LVFQGKSEILFILSCLLLVLCYSAGLHLFSVAKEIRYFLIFLVFIFLTRSVSITGDNDSIFHRELASEAGLLCWRLLLVMLGGLLFISTTPSSAIRAAVIWFLKPIPLVSEKTVGTMIGLVIRFLPLIFLQYQEIDAAMRSRGIERRKKPVVRMKKFTITLCRRVVLRADELTESMTARCYDENRTLPGLSFTKLDALTATTVTLLLGFVFFMQWNGSLAAILG
jgi:energy-coupling factor transporter transmembrane protein EcfT